MKGDQSGQTPGLPDLSEESKTVISKLTKDYLKTKITKPAIINAIDEFYVHIILKNDVPIKEMMFLKKITAGDRQYISLD